MESYSGVLQWSPAVESCSGEFYSGVLQWSAMQWRVLQCNATVESCCGVMLWSHVVESCSGVM